MARPYLAGLDVLKLKPSLAKKWGRVGLVCNQASLSENFDPSWKVHAEILGKDLVALFGPQHGFESTVQENMIESGHGRHRETGLPVYSLYSETRAPTAAMLENVDTLVVDLPITGCRIYTYKYTLSGCLRAAKKFDKKVVVLDRPNPLGGVFIEGPVLDESVKSFVGEYCIPTRHGLTMAEAALIFNQEIKAPLEVVKLESWDPSLMWMDYSRPFVLTSPNLQCFDACAVFPGMVPFEGCSVSEGRGTTLPFQLMGASYVERGSEIIKRAEKYLTDKDGFHLRAASFMPVIHKDAQRVCQGVHLIVTDAHRLQSVQLGAALMRAFWEDAQEHGKIGDGFSQLAQAGADFSWRNPPYEYEYKNLPIEIIFGKKDCHKWFTAKNFDLRDGTLTSGHTNFLETTESSLLYPRKRRSISI